MDGFLSLILRWPSFDRFVGPGMWIMWWLWWSLKKELIGFFSHVKITCYHPLQSFITHVMSP